MLGLLSSTPVGTSFAFRLAGLALILAGIWIPRVGFTIAAAGGILSGWSFVMVGHVDGTDQFWLGCILLLHLVGASFWIGILSPLRAIAGKQECLAEAARLGHRFGRVASFSVPGLIAAGAILAWNLLGDFALLTTTAYGFTLLAKIGLVACLLAVAASNKLRFVPAMKRGRPKGGNPASPLHSRRVGCRLPSHSGYSYSDYRSQSPDITVAQTSES